MFDILSGQPDAEAVLSEGAKVLGEDVRAWLGEPERLHVNAVAQPLICLYELAMWSALRNALPAPAAVAGYSVGELAGYACAAALDAGELASLARIRASAMDAACIQPGGLIALRGMTRAEVEKWLAGGDAWIAIANGRDAFVVGGEAAKLDTMKKQAGRRGARVTCIKVTIAAHTPLLQAAVEPFRRALEKSALCAPLVPVVAGIDGSWIRSRAGAIATLSAQVAATIEWARCLDTLYERGCRVFLELGPGTALASMVRELLPDDARARSVSEFGTLAGVVSWVQRVSG